MPIVGVQADAMIKWLQENAERSDAYTCELARRLDAEETCPLSCVIEAREHCVCCWGALGHPAHGCVAPLQRTRSVGLYSLPVPARACP